MIRRSAAILVSVGVTTLDAFVRQVRPLLRRPPLRRGVVLYYHAVTRRHGDRFAWQMDELLKRAHPFIAGSPASMVGGRRNVAVTFDDGFTSVLENAVPELVKRNIPFTMFVPTGCLGMQPSWVQDPTHPSFRERVISAAELRSLVDQPLAALGSHSITHPDFLTIDGERARQELVQSKADLEHVTGRRVDLFSFPHGRYSSALLDAALHAGYQRVFTVEPTRIESDANAYALGRVAADPSDWPIEFRLKIAGAYRWRAYLHRFSRRN